MNDDVLQVNFVIFTKKLPQNFPLRWLFYANRIDKYALYYNSIIALASKNAKSKALKRHMKV